MKHIINTTCLLITIAITTLSCSKGSATKNNAINWHNDFDNALQVANIENKLVMLDLYTDWCTWCTELDNRTFVAPSVINKANDFIAVKIDAEKDIMGAELVERYKIQGYPAVLFLDRNGNLLTKVNGFVEADAFVAYMDSALAMPHIIAEITSGNDDNIESVDYYINLGEIDKAYALFNDMVDKGSIYYIDGSRKNIDDLEENFVVAKYFDIGMKYMYESHDYEQAMELYQKMANEYTSSEYIYSIDINILNLYNARGDDDVIIEYIKNVALKRNNLPQEYIDMYQSVLKDLEQN